MYEAIVIDLLDSFDVGVLFEEIFDCFFGRTQL